MKARLKQSLGMGLIASGVGAGIIFVALLFYISLFWGIVAIVVFVFTFAASFHWLMTKED